MKDSTTGLPLFMTSTYFSVSRCLYNLCVCIYGIRFIPIISSFFLLLFFNSFLVLGSIFTPFFPTWCVYIYVCIHTYIMKKIRIRLGLLVMPMGKHGVAPLTMDRLMEV